MSSIVFSDAEIEAVRIIFHEYAARMMLALEGEQITEGQYEAYEVLYDKLLFFMGGNELQ